MLNSIRKLKICKEIFQIYKNKDSLSIFQTDQSIPVNGFKSKDKDTENKLTPMELNFKAIGLKIIQTDKEDLHILMAIIMRVISLMGLQMDMEYM